MEGTIAAGKNDLKEVFAGVMRVGRRASELEHQTQIVVLRNITVEGLDVFLKHHLFPQGIRPEVAFGGYGTMAQDVLRNGTTLKRAIGEARIVVLALALEELDTQYGSPGWRCGPARHLLAELFHLLKRECGATIVVNTFIPPLYPENAIVPARDGGD